jgi:hypothetical protein
MRPRVPGAAGGLAFFRGWLGGGARLRQEVFYLAYHLHWAWTEILALSTAERRSYVRLLAERIEQDNQAAEELTRQWRSRS